MLKVNKLVENQDLSLFNSPKVWLSEGLELGEMHVPILCSALSISSQLRLQHMETYPAEDSAQWHLGLEECPVNWHQDLLPDPHPHPQGKDRLKTPNNNNLLQISDYQKLKDNSKT